MAPSLRRGKGYSGMSQYHEPAEDFPYAQVDRDLGWSPNDDEFDLTLEAQRRIWLWVWQGDNRDMEGWSCRCAIMCWVFCDQLRSNSLSKMAKRIGKKKQSLGRWVEDFKREFPLVAKQIKHLNHE